MGADHVDELSSAFEVSDDNTQLVYEVLGKLIEKVQHRSEGLPAREHVFVLHLRPLLQNFFTNYREFVGKYAPFESPQLGNDIVIGLNRASRCVYYHSADDGLGEEGDQGDVVSERLPETNHTSFTEKFLSRCGDLVRTL